MKGELKRFILQALEVILLKTSNEIYYTYDSVGSLLSMNLNGTEYLILEYK